VHVPRWHSRVSLEQATAYLREHAGRNVTLHELAGVLGVTPRAVQYLFRRHLGTTPTAYLRQIRLERAHHELVHADPAVETVHHIAGRWGFGHPGRFSILYRQRFGNPPSHTLRRNPGSRRRG